MKAKRKYGRFIACLLALVMALSSLVMSPAVAFGSEAGDEHVLINVLSAMEQEAVAGDWVNILDIEVSPASCDVLLLRYEVVLDGWLAIANDIPADAALYNIRHAIQSVRPEDTGRYSVVIFYSAHYIENSLYVGPFVLNVSLGAEGAHAAPGGLIGFEGDYALSADGSPVSVIVLFQSNPAGVQIRDAQTRRQPLTRAEAERMVEDDHDLFRRELTALFAPRPLAAGQGYEIRWEYRRAINGVSITLPSNMVPLLADFDSVRAIFPNPMITLEPPSPSAAANPPGMAPGRATMRADEMHDLGFRGEGVLVAVLDTGIYLDHPAFAGAFPTLAEMQERNPDLTYADTIGGTFFGRNFYPDGVAANNPNETINITDHGTHVAGTIVGRDTGGGMSILGVAPRHK